MGGARTRGSVGLVNRRRVRPPRPVALALLLVTGACTATTGRSLPPPSTVVPATTVPAGPAIVSDATATTTWRRLPLGAGGFVTGLVVHPSGRMYARTDVGGAYRYDRDARTWTQMLVAGAVPEAEVPHPYNVESIAVAPSNPDIVLVSVGDDSNPGSESEALPATGRVLRSTDGGRTWAASGTAFFISGNAEHRQRSERLAIDPADRAVLKNLDWRKRHRAQPHDAPRHWCCTPGQSHASTKTIHVTPGKYGA